MWNSDRAKYLCCNLVNGLIFGYSVSLGLELLRFRENVIHVRYAAAVNIIAVIAEYLRMWLFFKLPQINFQTFWQ